MVGWKRLLSWLGAAWLLLLCHLSLTIQKGGNPDKMEGVHFPSGHCFQKAGI